MLNFETKPIIAMLHLKGNLDEEIMERMKKETEIYYRNCVDAVLVENYFGNTRNCIQALAYLHENVGEAKLTGGYRLKAKFIIHTVGPKYPTENCQLNLAKCYIESLNLAKKNEIHSITFPSISTGKFSYPKEEAYHIAVQTVKGWLKENSDYNMKVEFSCVDPTIYELIYSELNDTEKE